MRIESPKQLANGGFLHRLADAPQRRDYKPQPERLPKFIRWDLLLKQYEPRNGEIEKAAQLLGVTADSLRALGCGWDGESLTVPMRDSTGNVIGIRRRFPSGEKKAVTGSREGLFFNLAIKLDGLVLINEGVSDTAASLSLGFQAVGRPSCRGGTASLQAMCKNSRVVIIADNDEAGLMGAKALARELPGSKLLIPPCKDMRDWYRSGVSKEEIEHAASV